MTSWEIIRDRAVASGIMSAILADVVKSSDDELQRLLVEHGITLNPKIRLQMEDGNQTETGAVNSIWRDRLVHRIAQELSGTEKEMRDSLIAGDKDKLIIKRTEDFVTGLLELAVGNKEARFIVDKYQICNGQAVRNFGSELIAEMVKQAQTEADAWNARPEEIRRGIIAQRVGDAIVKDVKKLTEANGDVQLRELLGEHDTDIFSHDVKTLGQAKQVRQSLEHFATDLMELANASDNARLIVDKYQIRRGKN
ncbi:MAG: hypothetical protein LBH01_03285 [Verrucomicrobiales bacterium]|jgi:hypothetical protein|nr:hypothetical protein [Verrucomicrobiales bacterium]